MTIHSAHATPSLTELQNIVNILTIMLTGSPFNNFAIIKALEQNAPYAFRLQRAGFVFASDKNGDGCVFDGVGFCGLEGC